MKKLFFIIFGVLLMEGTALAHGIIHQTIKRLSSEIKQFPDSAALYQFRGELYCEHNHHKKALRDFRRCSRKGGQSTRLDFAFAQCFYKMGKTRKALQQLDHILTTKPQHQRSLRLKGRILADQNKHCQAAHTLQAIINTNTGLLPENYLEAAAAWTECAQPQSNTKATNTLQQGITDLGPLLVFFDQLVQIALDQNQLDEAIQQQTNIINYSIRKESPLYERALLYLKTGNPTSARHDLQAARTALAQLPVKFQQTAAMTLLRQQIDEAWPE